MPALDVTDATFERDVLDRSASVAVVVDLWAAWCGPCRTLGPILEKVVDEAPGVELVKIDVDSNPGSANAFQVQSIPAVFALKDRRVVDSFIGALPEPAVREWVERLSPQPSDADRLVAAGDEASLRSALELEPAHEGAVLALAGLLAADTDAARREEALGLLAKVPDSPEARHIAAVARQAGGSVATEGIEAKLDALLDRVRGDDSARQEFVDLLELLGPDDPRTARYRKALTTRLF